MNIVQMQKIFQELCDDNFEYLKHNDILYELNNNLNWIKDIILKCNKLGFFTCVSQPGSSHKNVIYKSEYDRKYRTYNILSTDGLRLQRAYVRGYMHKNMAKYIVGELIDDTFLFVRAENLNNICGNFDVKVGSVNFYENEPLVKKMHSIKCKDDLKNIPDGDASLNFESPLHRPFNFVRSDIDNIYCINIVEFDILDKRWNNNEYLWKKLYELIVAYNSNNIK